MAGGKETPRQKMIGLMYLVLTAMLALNVDSAVLERFIFINSVLEQQVEDNTKKNLNKIQAIKAEIEKRGNLEKDVAVLKKAQEVRAETAKLIEYTNEVKERIIQVTGGRDENDQLIGAKDIDWVANLMIVKKGGDTLKTNLNNYAAYLSSVAKKEFEPLALDGKDDPFFSKYANQKHKDFKELLFESTPTAAGLSAISQLQNEAINYETEALTVLGEQVGAGEISFDKIVPMVLPESKVVAAGATYNAKMFIAASSSGITPTMKFDGKPIAVDAEGYGDISFKASGGNYDKNGQVAKKFNAEITINDKVYAQDIEYIVAKPVIQIQSASVQALYLNCGNKLDVQVPALGASYNPSFRVSGGTHVTGKGGVVTIIPNSKEVVLSVLSDGTPIGNQTFNVRGIPKPDLVMKIGGREVDTKKGVDKPPRELRIDAIPDESFKQFLPDDARYRVTKWEVILGRGSRSVDRMEVSGPNADISRFAQKARAGDRIVVDIKEIQRMNFQNKTEVVNIAPAARVMQFPITE